MGMSSFSIKHGTRANGISQRPGHMSTSLQVKDTQLAPMSSVEHDLGSSGVPPSVQCRLHLKQTPLETSACSSERCCTRLALLGHTSPCQAYPTQPRRPALSSPAQGQH